MTWISLDIYILQIVSGMREAPQVVLMNRVQTANIMCILYTWHVFYNVNIIYTRSKLWMAVTIAITGISYTIILLIQFLLKLNSSYTTCKPNHTLFTATSSIYKIVAQHLLWYTLHTSNVVIHLVDDRCSADRLGDDQRQEPQHGQPSIPSLSASCGWTEAPSIGGLTIHDGHDGCTCKRLHRSHEVHQPAGAGVDQVLCHAQPSRLLRHERPHHAQHGQAAVDHLRGRTVEGEDADERLVARLASGCLSISRRGVKPTAWSNRAVGLAPK